jgi:SAM-dependent methyltransferase
MIPYFKNMTEYYSKATKEIGLWESEKDLITKYTNTDSFILDVGCGTGRISNALYELGYKNIIGIDFSRDMLRNARQLNNDISYLYNDAREMIIKDTAIDFCIFSFNGLVLIPGWDNRIKVIKEIHRVLKTGGIFIFTTDDYRIYDVPKYKEFWQQEQIRWEDGIQDSRLLDFGDVIFPVEEGEIYFYFNTIEEMINILNINGFEVIDHFDRNSKYKENDNVLQFSRNCRFWITKKI